jgi:hypothetical protein
MSEKLLVSGLLSERDLKRLTQLTRSSMIGPTALYYAGVTAPIISASMSVLVREVMRNAGLNVNLQYLIAALVAAMAGISWYLIFMRWSYRSNLGRGTELVEKTEVEISEAALMIRRGGIESRINWKNIEKIKTSGQATALIIRGADAVLIPHAWFEGEKAQQKAFLTALKTRAPD